LAATLAIEIIALVDCSIREQLTPRALFGTVGIAETMIVMTARRGRAVETDLAVRQDVLASCYRGRCGVVRDGAKDVELRRA
jgi:hypothetical protein